MVEIVAECVPVFLDRINVFINIQRESYRVGLFQDRTFDREDSFPFIELSSWRRRRIDPSEQHFL